MEGMSLGAVEHKVFRLDSPIKRNQYIHHAITGKRHGSISLIFKTESRMLSEIYRLILYVIMPTEVTLFDYMGRCVVISFFYGIK